MLKPPPPKNIITNDTDLSSTIGVLKEEKRKTKNFLYQISNNSVYLGKLNAIFE
jgi:hypothetical protein